MLSHYRNVLGDDAPGVEKLAKKFLRHPAIVCIGDEDSGKGENKTARAVHLGAAEEADSD